MPVGTDLTKEPLLRSVPVHEGYKVLGDVVLYQRLGKGGMGAVYRGRHLRLDIDVAVKVMSLPSDMTGSERDEWKQRFLREARTAASVKHQNLIRVADVNSHHGLYFLTMDCIDGESAGDRFDRRRTMSEAECVEICLGAAEGLGEAHAQGVVHRDVKPDNIMIDRKGRVTVTDLGLAKAYGDRGACEVHRGLSLTSQVIGTPHYMSPEQTRSSRDVGPPADVWSLGITLYELATGSVPWNDTDLHDLIHNIRFSPYPDPQSRRSDLSDGLAEILFRALGKHHTDRYADCSEMAHALRKHFFMMVPGGDSVLPDEQTIGWGNRPAQPPTPEVLAAIAQASASATTAGGGEDAASGDEQGADSPVGSTPPTVRGAGPRPVAALDDRTSFPVVQVLAQTVADLDPHLADADAAWEAFMSWSRRDRREYEALRRTAHSIFYYQLQDFYEFAIERLGRDDVPMIAGRAFSDTVYEEMLPQLLQVALRGGGGFQEGISEVFKAYLYRYTGSRYLLQESIGDDNTSFIIRSRDPEAGLLYCQLYGLNPVRALKNSLLYITGALEELLVRIVADFDRTKIQTELTPGGMRMLIPVTDKDRFAYEAMSQTLAAYVRRVEERATEVAKVDRMENDLAVTSEAMRATWDRINRASRTDEIVLLRGESGTGKSYFAQKIHKLSQRAARPFIEVGLASEIGAEESIESDLFGIEPGTDTAAPKRKKGLFSLADGGTIFLDEVGDASPELQAKLLRVIEKSRFKRVGGVSDVNVDVRVVAATSRNHEQMVEEGSFRRDLYYRLNVISIRIPPLREHPEDVEPFAQFLLSRTASKGSVPMKGFAPGLLDDLRRYPWPGNIRELDHALKHAATLSAGADITKDDLPANVLSFLEHKSGRG
jgi:hypothetical protein